MSDVRWCDAHYAYLEGERCWVAVEVHEDDRTPCRPFETDARRIFHVELVIDQNGPRLGPLHGSSGISAVPDKAIQSGVRRYHNADHVRITADAWNREEADRMAADLARQYGADQ